MFTGIITDIGRVASVSEAGAVRRIRIEASDDPGTIALGASIACSGPCLTVVAVGGRAEGGWFEVDAAAETLARTTAAAWRPGTRLNLERSLRLGDELGGHIVTGHIDGVAEILRRDAITGGQPLGTERALRHPRAALARRAHRGERLGRARRRLADGERRRR